MNIDYNKVKLELGSRKIKQFYVFANCPKIIFDEFISIIRDVLGKRTRVIFISSQKDSIIELFATRDFFSDKKVIVVDLERLVLSQKQVSEVIRLFSSYTGKELNRVFIIRSFLHSIMKDIQTIAKQKGFFFWITWSGQDIISILRGRFPDVRFVDGAEDLIKELSYAGADVYEIVSKAVLYAFPARYIDENHIIHVLPMKFSIRLKDMALSILSGELKNLPAIDKEQDISALISFLAQYFVSFVKLKSEGEAYGSVKKYQIAQVFRTQDVDKLINSMRSNEIKNLVKKFVEFVEKERIGILSPDIYLMRFVLSIAGKGEKNLKSSL